MSRPPREAAEALAKQRLIILTAIRFSGIALVLLGFAIMNGVIDLPAAVGAVFVLVGVADVFVMPVVLVRRWKAADRRRP